MWSFIERTIGIKVSGCIILDENEEVIAIVPMNKRTHTDTIMIAQAICYAKNTGNLVIQKSL